MRRRMIAAAALALGFFVTACGPASRTALQMQAPSSRAEVASALADCERPSSGAEGVAKCVLVANSEYSTPDQAYAGHLRICGISALRRGRPVDRRLRHCDEAIALKPAAAAPHAAKAQALARSGKLPDALASADRAVALDGRHEDARIIRAFLRNALDDRLGALGDIRAYNEVVAAAGHMRRAGAYALEAQILTGLGRLDDARTVTDAGRAAYPKHYLLDRADAWIEIKRRDADAALAYAERALATQPKSVYSRVTRAVAYLHAGDVEGALGDFRVARAREALPRADMIVGLLEALIVVGKTGLRRLGHDPGGAGPEVDADARRALRAFQQAHGLEADGRFTIEALDAVLAAARMGRGRRTAPEDLARRFLEGAAAAELQT